MPITISEGANLLTERRGVVPPGSPLALLNHPAQSAAPIDGWKAVLFGLPFLLTGIGIALAALNVVNTRKNVPDWLIGLIGCFFFAAGACLIIHGLRGARQRRPG